MFIADPERYAPQYSAYCASAMSYSGRKLDADPQAWLILNGKLYVFHSAEAAAWFRADLARIERADANWSKWYSRR